MDSSALRCAACGETDHTYTYVDQHPYCQRCAPAVPEPAPLSINQMPWPIMGSGRCTDRALGHEPLPMPYGFAFMQASSHDRRVEVRVCRNCGCLYYECWKT